MTTLTNEEAVQLARTFIHAGARGEPMPPVPEGVPERAAKDAYNLGVVRRQCQELKKK